MYVCIHRSSQREIVDQDRLQEECKCIYIYRSLNIGLYYMILSLLPLPLPPISLLSLLSLSRDISLPYSIMLEPILESNSPKSPADRSP